LDGRHHVIVTDRRLYVSIVSDCVQWDKGATFNSRRQPPASNTLLLLTRVDERNGVSIFVDRHRSRGWPRTIRGRNGFNESNAFPTSVNGRLGESFK